MPDFAAIKRRLGRVRGPLLNGRRHHPPGTRFAVDSPAPAVGLLAAPDPGIGVVYPTIAAEPTRDYVSGGFAPILPDARQVLSRTTDEVATEFGGDRLWDLMEHDPTIASALWAIVYAAVGPIGLTAAASGSPDLEAEVPPEVVEAEEAVALVNACTDGMEREPEAVLAELAVDALKYGCMLAEQVYEVIDGGEFAGMLRLKALKVKPRLVWQFVVDAFNTTVGFLCQSAWGGGFQVLPPAKFLVIAWGRRKGDPRGRSILRAAFNAWNILVQLWPQLFQFLNRFASPGLVGKAGKDERARPGYPTDGVPVPSTGQVDVSPERNFLKAILGFQQGKAIVIGPEDELTALETNANGDAFMKAIALLKREMTQAILLAVRATMESEHGSKADSETAQDLMGLVSAALRKLLCGEYRRQVVYPILLYNKGKDYADRNLPSVAMGEAEPQDKAGMWNAFANLVRAGCPLTRSQLIKTMVSVGLPAPEPGEEVEDEPAAQEEPGEAEPDEGDAGEGQDGQQPQPPPKSKSKAKPKEAA